MAFPAFGDDPSYLWSRWKSGPVEEATSPESRGGCVARRPNYGHEKRQREKKRQQKKAEKAERKRLKAEEEAAESQPPEGDQDGEETE